MTDNIRGVNLGGWLVVEKWMTPGLFRNINAIDEYTLSHSDGGKKRLQQHRESFITEDDFVWLKDHSITFVRIPVGYWLFDDIDGYMASVDHLDNAMKWAQKHRVRVLICLHGARGSQNGFDNSGRHGRADWFNKAYYRQDTLEVLEGIAKRYKDSPILWGIELLNEPTPKRHYFTMLHFHRKAYKKLGMILRPETHIVFHDAFQPLIYTGSLWKRRKHPVMMDIHWYAFSLNNIDLDRYLKRSAQIRRTVLSIAQLWQPVIVGEWSTVLPQRYFDQIPESEHKELLKRNATMQQQVYKKASGWIYWSYKLEGGGMWNFRDLVEKGIIDPKL